MLLQLLSIGNGIEIGSTGVVAGRVEAVVRGVEAGVFPTGQVPVVLSSPL